MIKNPSSNFYITGEDQIKLQTMAKFRSHAVMLIGYHGADLNKIIDQFIWYLNQHYQLTQLSLSPEEGKKNISIDAVRQLSAKLKLTKNQNELISVAITNAKQLSSEAATALLKILEEPNRGTMFILGVASEDQILPTIASRCYKLKLKKPSMVQLAQVTGLDQSKLKSKLSLAGGRLDILSNIIEDDSSNHTSVLLEDAKTWVLSNNKKTRLEISDKYFEEANHQLFLEALSGVTASLIEHFISKGNSDGAIKLTNLQSVLDQLIKTEAKLNLNKKVIQIKLNSL